MSKELIKKLKEYQEARKMSQEDLARIIGVSHVSLNRWLVGKTKPSKLALRRIREIIE